MSFIYTKAVWNNPQVSGGALLVLLCLAEHADEKGTCYPSVERIGKMTAQGERGVRYALKTLLDKGLVKISRGGGRNSTNLYHLSLETLHDLPPATLAPLQMDTETLQMTTVNTAPFAPKPSLTIKEPSSITVFDLPAKGGTYSLPQDLYDTMVGTYSHVNVMGELGKMHLWLTTSPSRIKTLRGMPKFVNGWLSRIPKGQSNGRQADLTDARRGSRSNLAKIGDSSLEELILGRVGGSPPVPVRRDEAKPTPDARGTYASAHVLEGIR